MLHSLLRAKIVPLRPILRRRLLLQQRLLWRALHRQCILVLLSILLGWLLPHGCRLVDNLGKVVFTKIRLNQIVFIVISNWLVLIHNLLVKLLEC